jgi:hypothetical protein
MAPSAGTTPSSAGSPTSPGGIPSPKLSSEEISLARYATYGLELLSGILAIISMFAYWWLMTGTGTNIAFFPGTQIRFDGTFSAYASAGMGQVEGVYLAVLVFGVVGGITLVASGALSAVMTYRHKPESGMLFGLGIIGIVLEALAVAVAPLMSPWALNASSGGSSFCSMWTSGSPCSTFWGTGFYNGVSTNFVAGDGWILMVGALVLSIIAFSVWAFARNTD